MFAIVTCLCGNRVCVHAGKHMKYAERSGKGLINALMSSVVLSLIGVVFVGACKIPWLRKMLPIPGQGPSEKEMHSGFFKLKLWALPQQPSETEASASNGSEPVRVYSEMAVSISSHPC
jgi:hypothetical protein